MLWRWTWTLHRHGWLLLRGRTGLYTLRGGLLNHCCERVLIGEFHEDEDLGYGVGELGCLFEHLDCFVGVCAAEILHLLHGI